METIIRVEKLRLKGSPLEGENPQPFFREADLSVSGGGGFPEDKYGGFGRETGFRVLPYTVLDRYDRRLVDLEFPSVVMENDFLKAEFLPGLGGRLWSLYDKKRKRDLLYRNPVFRPANLAIREAWFSGGIEWNIGRFGHTVHTCAPVFAGTFHAGGISVFRIWEFERQTRLLWRVEFTLPPDSPALFAYVRVDNPAPDDKPLYWWTNAAVPQTGGTRVFSATNELIYFVPGTGKQKTMGGGKLPDIPVLPGRDASYPALFDYAGEYFFQNDKAAGKNSGGFGLPWESAVYEDGYAYVEASTLPLLYRKMFCWGNGRGGKRWQDFLSMPGEAYLEVQAGLAPTQLHTANISGLGIVDFVQAFTALEVKPETAFQKDYERARACVETLVAGQIGEASLQTALEAGRKRGDEAADILFTGSGWGALERRIRERQNGGARRESRFPGGLSFPDESVGAEEAPWAELLEKGALPPRPANHTPGSFVTDKAWETLLENSPLRNGDWLTPYHLGVIAYERGGAEKAAALWKKSAAALENPWAYRNLALAAKKQGNVQAALEYYKRAFSFKVPGGRLDKSFTEEYVPLLMQAGREEEAAVCLAAAGPEETFSVPLLEAAATIALNHGDDAALDRIFSREPAHIREGDDTLAGIWTEREIRRLAGTTSLSDAERQVREALSSGALPREIDFRMYTAGCKI
ncbi:MAG: DUF5107 domain-containing protein [Treponema sp.]|nr:DUF5107 domain-containing protein [Treponema sp.]